MISMKLSLVILLTFIVLLMGCAEQFAQVEPMREQLTEFVNDNYDIAFLYPIVAQRGEPIKFFLDHKDYGFLATKDVEAEVILTGPGVRLKKDITLGNRPGPPPPCPVSYCTPGTVFGPFEIVFDEFKADNKDLTLLWTVQEDEKDQDGVYTLSATSQDNFYKIKPSYFKKEVLPESALKVDEVFERRLEGETTFLVLLTEGYSIEVIVADKPIDPSKLLRQTIANEDAGSVYHEIFYSLLSSGRKVSYSGQTVLINNVDRSINWPSGRFFVSVHWFHQEFPEDGKEDVISRSLAKYPSSL